MPQAKVPLMVLAATLLLPRCGLGADVDGRRPTGSVRALPGCHSEVSDDPLRLNNVEFALTVTDTQTGAVKTSFNPQSQLASVADTSAF
jgi:hypothetical protein